MSHGNPSFAENHQLYYLKPQLLKGAAASTAYIPVTSGIRIWAIVSVGANDVTVDAKLEQAKDADGTDVKDVTGAKITQITGTDQECYVSIDLEPALLDLPGGFTYVRLTVTAGAGTTGAQVAGFVLVRSRHMPVAQPEAFVESVEVAG